MKNTLLEMRRVQFHLATGEKMMAPDIDLVPGKCIALAGAAGSGKNIILRIAAGLVKQDQGIVSRNTKRMGFIFQEGGVQSSLTTIDNLIVPLVFTGLSERDAIEQARNALAHFDLLGIQQESSSQLSAQSRMLLQYARADALGVEMLLAEEPLQGLGDKAQSKVEEWWKEGIVTGRRGAILSTTDRSVALRLDATILRIGPIPVDQKMIG
jgi:ABC-type nitrate/sulfonate/bicarbonate transport system ATPase subunit